MNAKRIGKAERIGKVMAKLNELNQKYCYPNSTSIKIDNSMLFLNELDIALSRIYKNKQAK